MSQVRTLTPNFTIVTLKMWAYSPKMDEIVNFWYKFAEKGYTPYVIYFFFTKFGLGKESQVRTLMPNFTAVALKMCVFAQTTHVVRSK